MAAYEAPDGLRDSAHTTAGVLLEKAEDDEALLQELFSRTLGRRPDPNAVRFRSVRFHLDQNSNCHRCGKKVYPVEKVDIGVLYHKGCFKCRVCARQLTLRTFQRELDPNESRVKEVYCDVHVPRQVKGHIDLDAAGIRSAISAQKRASRKIHRPTFPEHHYLKDYTYDGRPGSGQWSTGSSASDEDRHLAGNGRDEEVPLEGAPPGTVRDTAREFDGPWAAATADSVPPRTVTSQWQEGDTGTVTSEHGMDIGIVTSQGLADDRTPSPPPSPQTTPPAPLPPRRGIPSEDRTKPAVLPPVGDGGVATLRPLEEVKKRNGTIRRRSTLTSFQDFEKFGVFDAQSMLEKIHRQEEDELYRQIYDERRAIVRQVEEALRGDREQSVRDLIAFFEKNQVPASQRQTALIEVEEYYRRRREAALKTLLAKLAAEEQSAVARMVEKHSNEMIQLIREKDRLASLSTDSSLLRARVPSDRHDVDDDADRHDVDDDAHRHDVDDDADRHDVDDDADMADLPLNQPGTRHADVPRVRPTVVLTPWPGGEEQEEQEEQEETNKTLEVSAIPEAEPPECPKNRLFTTPDVFIEQDKQAIEESKKEHKTFTDLVRQLSRRCQTELQKVRALFRWVTVKDLNRMRFEKALNPDSPLGLLRGIKMGTESYHDLFRRLCSYAGLHCEVIEGFSKGAGYRAGTPIGGPVFRNQWTAVWVDGSWRFINCKWGARHVKGTRDVSLTYKCDEFYFLTDPEEHIYQHFPDDPMWQLLPEPVTVDDFIRLPVAKSPFFNNKLSFVRHYDATLEAADGIAEVRLQCPRMLGVTAKLKSNSKEIPSEILQERTLVRYIGREIAITVNLPSPGLYILDVYVSPDWDSERMDSACAFQIHCTGISRDANVTFPQLGSFGRTPAFVECGMCEETHTDPYVTSCDGTLTVTFSLTKNVSLRPSLRRWDPRDRTMDDFDRFSLLRHRTSHVASFDVQLPRRGMFVFTCYVTNPDDTSSPMVCVYRYLFECRSPKLDALPFPKATKRYKHCLLIEPLSGELNPDSEVEFGLESRKALEVIIVIGDTSQKLKQSGRKWHGPVSIKTVKGKVIVYARFESNSEKYIPLLEYQVKGKKNMSFIS